MNTSRKKICLLVCGAPAIPGNKPATTWLKNLPELNIIADVEPLLVFDQPSANITPAVWEKLAATIYANLSRFDGFVVIHDPDNVLFTAAAMSLLLHNLSRPVVFTSSQWEVKANLINSLQAASSDITEVVLLSGNRLLRANQATMGTNEAVSAPEPSVLGQIDFSVRVFDRAQTNSKAKTKLFKQLDRQVAPVILNPTITADLLMLLAGKKLTIIADASNYEQLPESLIKTLEQVAKTSPLVLWRPKPSTTTMLKNSIVVDNLTWPTTVVKTMWALSQSKQIKKVKSLLNSNQAGEILN